MSIFTNQLILLRKENRRMYETLKNEELKHEIADMNKYLLSSFHSAYQVQIIQKDIIGMAPEAEAANISMDEVLGYTPKQFCDEIISNAGKLSFTENILQWVTTLLQLFTVFYFTNYFFVHSAPAEFGITIADLILIFVWCLFGVALPDYLNHQFALTKPFGFVFSWAMRITALLCYVFLLRIPEVQQFILPGNGFAILAVLIVLTLIATAAMNRYWDRCAKQYAH